MRSLLLCTLSLILSFSLSAQSRKVKPNKYPSLLWEITGKGMSKPSYLFGTMHVSSKMAFHLSDSFYLGIRSADVVALETNPGDWQEDFSRYDLFDAVSMYGMRRSGESAEPRDFLSIQTLKAFPYEKMLARALYSNPSMINNFLYRNNSAAAAEFEEDTYLDLYIYQVGRKWNKKLSGVEDFDESMNLMKEAYVDAAKDMGQREVSYDSDNEFSYSKLEEAYRTGNLDLLDTINKVNSSSAAFDEKFLYKRNEIQAKSIDSILKTKQTLFVGVGAAHLPGERGVIEMLRRMGYKLRPIKMTERDSRHKEAIEAIRVPVRFSQQAAEDSAFTVSIPGKLYSFTGVNGWVSQKQYADMSNGSYYMVTRISTLAPIWGHGTGTVLRKLDSLLYENIPGKILTKTAIRKNGYQGFDIVNRTRRGDYQRYQVFVTPFELLLFKVSGSGEYIRQGKEADTFFNSIQLKEVKQEVKKWSPSYGGFEVELPHVPHLTKADNFYYQAYDAATATAYQVIRTDIHNVNFVEEDSFDLNLLEESFAASEFIEKQTSRRQTRLGNYAALDANYLYKDGSVAEVRFIIQGPRYYTLVANSPKKHAGMTNFIRSFNVKPLVYRPAIMQKDTSLYFTVQSPVLLEKPKKLSMYPENMYNFGRPSLDDENLEEKTEFRDKLVAADSTGEKIYVSFYKTSRYYYNDDTATSIDSLRFRTDDQEWVYRSKSKKVQPDGTTVWDYVLGDSLSSRVLRGRSIRKKGLGYRILVQGDTATRWSPFVEQFFQSFTPADTVQSTDPFVKKTDIFFADFFSKDTTAHKRAVRNVDKIRMDSTDFRKLRSAIQSLTWKEKKYLDVKKSFISKLATTHSPEAAAYLKEVYFAAGDTVDLQYVALESLLQQRRSYSFQEFLNIMTTEPPVLNVGSNNNGNYNSYRRTRNYFSEEDDYSNGNFLDDLYDSLELTRTIFPQLLPLITVNDYEKPMLDLLEVMVDSNLVNSKDYENYLPKLLIEAKQEMKKQVITEKNASIEKAQKTEGERKNMYMYGRDRDKEGYGNDKLGTYAVMLLPFWDKNPLIPQLFQQMLSSNDKRLKYNTAWLLLRKGKTVPDTLLRYFAGLDEFRSELYSDLKKLELLHLYPKQYNSHITLAKSELLSMGSYSSPDTVVYMQRLPVQYRDREGWVYFFKYKRKKDDNGWKIATVGIIPKEEDKYSFASKGNYRQERVYDFTELSNVKLDPEEAELAQLQKQLKKMLYSKRKSASEFYENEGNDMDVTVPIEE